MQNQRDISQGKCHRATSFLLCLSGQMVSVQCDLTSLQMYTLTSLFKSLSLTPVNAPHQTGADVSFSTDLAPLHLVFLLFLLKLRPLDSMREESGDYQALEALARSSSWLCLGSQLLSWDTLGYCAVGYEILFVASARLWLWWGFYVHVSTIVLCNNLLC